MIAKLKKKHEIVFNVSINKHELVLQVLIDQITFSFRIEARMNRVLSALDLDPVQGLPPKLRKFVKTLSKAMDALDAANSSLPMLVVAVTEMQDKINKSSVDIELLEERCRVLREDCNEVKDLYALLERYCHSCYLDQLYTII